MTLYFDTIVHVSFSPERRTRVEQQEATRLALLDAAIELFVEQGVAATSIEDVTRRAGFSRGAFYSNFDSKNDLFLETSKRFIELLHAAAAPPTDEPASPAGAAYAERMSRMRSLVGDGASVFLAELSLYAIRHPELLEEAAQIHHEQLAPAITFVRARLDDAGIKRPSVPIETLANIAQCLTFGLHLIGRVDPEVAPEASVATAMDLIMRGLAKER
jgi:AcrR family transcriptional regulator